MKKGNINFCGFVILIGLLVFTKVTSAQTRPGIAPKDESVIIPKEPGWKSPAYRGWELMGIPGLISTYYDLDLNGKLDYMVIRKILRQTSAEKTSVEQVVEIAKNENLSVYVSHPTIYFTVKFPLFYCLGVDFRRNCRDIWVDIAEDGLNGNETRYTLSAPLPNVR